MGQEIIIIESDDTPFEEQVAKNTLRVLAFSLNGENYCIEITAEIEDGLIGVVVDKIFEAMEVERDSVQPPLATLEKGLLELTIGQVRSESGIMAFLDLKKILELEGLRHAK